MTFVWDIDPVLLRLGPIEIRYYGLLFATGLLLASHYAAKFFTMKGYDEEELNSAVLWLIVGLILGAHWVHLIFYEPYSLVEDWNLIKAAPVATLTQFWKLRFFQLGSGLASHGGGIGAGVALFLICRKRGVSFYRYADPISAAALWVVPTIRLGNFFNSEIYGRETDGSWGVIFARRGFTEPRIPSQLVESIIGLGVVLFLMWFYKTYHKKIKEGALFYLMMFTYFSSRFLVEFIKEWQFFSPDQSALTEGQLLSIPLILIGAWQIFINPRFRIRNLSA